MICRYVLSVCLLDIPEYKIVLNLPAFHCTLALFDDSFLTN